jgi:hypothetical protein
VDNIAKICRRLFTTLCRLPLVSILQSSRLLTAAGYLRLDQRLLNLQCHGIRGDATVMSNLCTSSLWAHRYVRSVWLRDYSNDDDESRLAGQAVVECAVSLPNARSTWHCMWHTGTHSRDRNILNGCITLNLLQLSYLLSSPPYHKFGQALPITAMPIVRSIYF